MEYKFTLKEIQAIKKEKFINHFAIRIILKILKFSD